MIDPCTSASQRYSGNVSNRSCDGSRNCRALARLTSTDGDVVYADQRKILSHHITLPSVMCINCYRGAGLCHRIVRLGTEIHLTPVTELEQSTKKNGTNSVISCCLERPSQYLVVMVKDKVLPYSLPCIGPGADPGVQAVSPQVTKVRFFQSKLISR